MNKKKVFKIIIIVFVIAIILLFIHTFRNFMIISELQEKFSEYSSSTNYYVKSVSTQNNSSIISYDYYYKDNNQVCFLEQNNDGKIVKTSIYYNGQSVNTYIESEDSKIANLNSANTMSFEINNGLQTDSSWQTFIYSVLAKIKTVEYNNKVCYCIEDFFTPYAVYGTENNKSYIEKETGLEVKNISNETVVEKKYEFDNVDDSIFIEPDINEYEIQE